jgi:3-hydroxybutyryl-CoA dehydrogenase
MRDQQVGSVTGKGRVAVVGAGNMGGGIATVLAQHGYPVRLHDPVPAALERAAARVRKRADGADLELTDDLAAVALGCDLVIEAVPETLALKRAVFEVLDRTAPEGAVLATNTSQLSVTALAAATSRPSAVVGMHWFNPPERMRLIELVRTVLSAPEAVDRVRALAEDCGKTVVEVQDRQGFVTTRALAALLIEAMRMHEEGVAEAAALDTAVELGLNHPMGPLALADYVGLDVMLAIADALTEQLGERFRAPQGLRKRVEAGRLGRKTGHGYHRYDE